MGISERLDRFQRRHPAAGFPLAVLYKYFDDSGGYLAAHRVADQRDVRASVLGSDLGTPGTTGRLGLPSDVSSGRGARRCSW